MSQASFFPYAFATSAIKCDWELRGVETEWTPSHALRVLDDLPTDGALRLSVRATVAANVLSTVFPEAERSNPPSRVVLVLRSPSSRLRQATDLDRSEDNVYTGELELRTSVLHGELDAFVSVIRSAQGAFHPGFAFHKAAILSTSDPLTILLEEPPSPPGGYLAIDFEDFHTSPSPLRRTYADQLFALDTEDETPKLWLNEAIPEFAGVMQSNARRGVPRRVRDATYDTICVQVWTSLLGIALSTLALALEDEMEHVEAIASLEDWQHRAIRFWAPRLYPEMSDTDQALDALAHAAGGRERLPELFERVSLAVQKWAGSAGAFDGLVRVLRGEGV